MFDGRPFVFQGFQIPSSNPVFLFILSMHILAALTCVVTGCMAMMTKKQAGLHPRTGTVYYFSLWIVFITAAAIAIMRWREDYHLFILGFFSLGSAFIGRMAVKNKWEKWSVIHISGMGFSYIILLTAFYVDNGKSLPLWKLFNPLLYWLLPALVGIPIMVRTLLQHPLSRRYFGRNRVDI
jgi:hypothetical protein